MATYSCDLITLTTNDTNDMTEPSAGGWTQLNAQVSGETDFFIQGTGCTSATIKTGVGGLLTDNISFSMGTDDAVLVWAYFWAPGVLNNEASGGVRQLIGSSTNAFFWVPQSGSDDWYLGGWRCFAMGRPDQISGTTQVGSPNLNALSHTGWAYSASTVPSRGYPFGCDAVRVGRGQIKATGTGVLFAEIAQFNDYNDATNGFNRFGLFSFSNGSYNWKGQLLIGETGVASATMTDQNKLIFVENTKFVTAGYNVIEVQHTGTSLSWTGMTIQALGTVSKGRFIQTDANTVNKSSCTFVDMDSFTYNAGGSGSITDTIYRRCGIVTQGGRSFSGCTFNAATGTTAIIASNVSTITDCNFISSGTGYAIQGFASAGSYDVSSNTFTGYGSTGTTNAALRVTATSGDITINAPVGTTYNSAGANVTIVSGQRTLTLTGIVSGSDIVILLAGTTTELANNDGATNPVTSYGYTYSYSAGTFVDVCVYKQGYVPFTVRNYLLADSDGSLPINQVVDRNFVV